MPPKSTTLFRLLSKAIAGTVLAGGEEAGVTSIQVLLATSYSQVSLRRVLPSLPPKSTTLFRLLSKTIACPLLAEGEEAGVTSVQVWLAPSYSQLSPKSVLSSQPPKRTTLLRLLSKAIACLNLAGGEEAVVTSVHVLTGG
ncbi:hypothetical protein ES703_92355 [subsurface metagenome]